MLKQLLLAFCFVCSAWGASLQWNASVVDEQHAAPTGYRIHRGTAPGVYDWQIDVGNVLQWPIPDDLYGEYYWSVSAYNDSGSSGYSNEVYWQRAPTEPPQYVGATNLSASKLQRQTENHMAFLVGQNTEYTSDDLYYSGDELIFYRLGYTASQSGTAENAYILVNDTWTANNLKICVYDSSGALIGTATFALSGSGWLNAPFSSTFSIESGQTYYIGFIIDTGYIQLRTNTTSYSCDYSTAGSYASPPSSISVPGTDRGYNQPGIYIDGTIGGGASAVPKIMLLQDHFSGGIY